MRRVCEYYHEHIRDVYVGSTKLVFNDGQELQILCLRTYVIHENNNLIG